MPTRRDERSRNPSGRAAGLRSQDRLRHRVGTRVGQLNVGLLLFLALATWGLLAHPDAPGGAAFAGVALLAAAGWVAGVLTVRVDPALPGVAVAVLAAVVIALGLPGSLTGAAAPGPLGYGNANAALVTAAVAGLLGAALGSAPERRHRLLVAAGVFTAVAFTTGSRAGATSCVLLLVCWALLPRGRVVVWQLSSVLVVVGLLSLTVYLGLTLPPGQQRGTNLASDVIGGTREALWSDALQETTTRPATGIGPGQFATHSATATSDPDLRWAHSTPLQVLAELGIVGFALLLILVAWLLWRLGQWSFVVAVLALQPMMDYVLSFPVVVAADAVVLGSLAVLSSRSPSYDETGVSARARP